MTEHDEDMKRWDRIERILQTAIDQESAGTETGLRHFKSANVILCVLGGIAGEADWSELVRLLMIDALYTRLEIMMRGRGRGARRRGERAPATPLAAAVAVIGGLPSSAMFVADAPQFAIMIKIPRRAGLPDPAVKLGQQFTSRIRGRSLACEQNRYLRLDPAQSPVKAVESDCAVHRFRRTGGGA